MGRNMEAKTVDVMELADRVKTKVKELGDAVREAESHGLECEIIQDSAMVYDIGGSKTYFGVSVKVVL